MVTLNTSRPKANKEHKCNFCHGAILKGETYESATNKADGDLYTWKRHAHCMKLINTPIIEKDAWEDGYTSEDFFESLQEYFHNRKEFLGYKNLPYAASLAYLEHTTKHEKND